MNSQLSIFLVANKDNDNLFESLVSFIVTSKGIDEPTVEKLKLFVFSYFEKCFCHENFMKENLTTSFVEFVGLGEEIKALTVLSKFLSQITDKEMAFILSKLINNNKLEDLCVFIVLIENKLIEKYIPGIFSFLFKLTNQNQNCKLVLSLVCYILSQDIKFDLQSEKIITQFFLESTDKIYCVVWYTLAMKFNLEKPHYILKLIHNDFDIRDEWYQIINDNILEHYSPLLIYKLIQKDKFVFKNSVFELIKKEFRDTGEIENIIYLIQQRFESQIALPIYHLLPISYNGLNLILSNCTNEDTSKYLNKAVLIEDGVFLAKYFLQCQDSTTRKLIEKDVDIKSLLVRHENRLFEWLFVKTEQCLMEYEKIYNILSDIIGYSTTFDENQLSGNLCEGKKLNLNSLLKEKIGIESKMYRILLTIYYFKEHLPDSNIEDLINMSISILYKIKNKELAISVFKIIKLLIYGDDDFTKDFLHSIFYVLLYYDIDCPEIRIYKYQIFSCLIFRWFVIDKRLFPGVCKQYLEFSDLEVVHSKSYYELIKIDSDNTSGPHSNPEGDSVYVLCFKLWDEIKIMPEETEIESLIGLLTTIITITGSFYQRRFLPSSLFKRIVSYCENNLETKNNLLMFSFLNKITKVFNIPQETKCLLLDIMSKSISGRVDELSLSNTNENTNK